ncbi:hypothetical protein TrRE_jg6141 [Triparma retinervis]|uniref:Solute carrier family 40 member n=1 Tax=Triparma retinervis TaxID=2557542 RepID=A0A9W6ZY42_9STRA|nr:hypothetical protein TrRE_jg6141 [Triparma retinervis]
MLVSYASQYVGDNDASLAMLVAGVCGSRVGLWSCLTDDAGKDPGGGERSSWGDPNSALCSAFEMLSYVMGIVWAKPEEFKNLIDISYAGMIGAAACYRVYWARS